MDKFKSFFLKSFNIKTTVSIWMMVIIVMNMFFNFLCGETAMNYITILQALLIASVIGLLHIWLLDSKAHITLFCTSSIIWMIASFACVNFGLIAFNWVSGWLFFALYDILMAMGIFTMVVGTMWLKSE